MLIGRKGLYRLINKFKVLITILHHTLSIPYFTARRRKVVVAERAGVKEIRLHNFRYSYASLLINSGANISVVSKYLGHSDINETLNTYSHMFDSALNSVINVMNELKTK